MRQSTTRWLALLAMTASLLYLCWLMASPFMRVMLWAAVLAVVAQPAHARVRRWVRSPGAAAGLTTVGILLALLLPLFTIGAILFTEITGLVPAMERTLRELPGPASPWVQWIDRFVNIDPYLDPQFIREKARDLGSLLAAGIISTVGSLAILLGELLLTLFTLFFLLRDGEQIGPALTRLLPVPPEAARLFVGRCQEVITASLTGILFIAAAQGALGAIAFLFLRLPSPIMWGAVMFLLAMVPIGPVIVWAPAAILLAVTGHWIRALVLVAWGIFVIGMADNILRPRLVGRRTRLHELLVFFSILGGLQVFGILGLIVGPVVVALAIAAVQLLFALPDQRPRPAQGLPAPVGAGTPVVESPVSG